MSYRFSIGLTTALLFLSSSSCKNLFSDFTDRTSFDYIVEQTRIHLDREDFDLAIATIEPLLETNPKNEEVAVLASSAYAGRAGVRTLDQILAIGESSGAGLFEVFTVNLAAADEEDLEDLERARTIIEAYGATAADRSPDANFYALFLWYSRVGANLAFHAVDAGEVRTNFTACHGVINFAGARTGLPNATVDRVMTSIARIVDTLPGISSDADVVAALGGITSALPTAVTDIIGMDPIPCEDAVLPDPNAIACLGVRTLINGSSLGLGTGIEQVPEEVPAGTCLGVSL